MIRVDDNIDFKDFVASMHTDFSTQDIIPIENYEDNWKNWAKIVSNSPTFVKAGVPQPDNFSNWREWGKLLYQRFG